MASLVGLLAMMSIGALWVFLKFQPVTSNIKALKTVNWMILGLAGVLAIVWVARTYAMYDLNDAELTMVSQYAAFGAMCFFVLVVSVGFFIRNFLIFKPDRFYR